MHSKPSYEVLLDAIGCYLDSRKAIDALIDEIEGGFLVAFVDGKAQRVVTLDDAEMQALQTKAGRHKCPPWPILAAATPSQRVRLRALGRYFDRRSAGSIVAQERGNGFTVEYAGVAPSDSLGLIRMHDTIDNERLRVTLSQTT